jgi:hypothetical protein
MGKVVLDISAGLPVRNQVRLIIGHGLSCLEIERVARP